MAHWLDDEGKELFQTGAYVPKKKGKLEGCSKCKLNKSFELYGREFFAA